MQELRMEDVKMDKSRTPKQPTHQNIPVFLEYWFKNEDNSSITRNSYYMMNEMFWAMDKAKDGEKDA